MLNSTRLFEKLFLKIFRASNNEVVKNGNNKANKIVINSYNKLKNNESKNLIRISNIRVIKKPIFLIFSIKKTFNRLKQAFIKALIF